MTKIIKASISGLVFNMDPEAYNLLSRYLGEIKRLLNDDINSDDTLSDIESNFSEKLLIESNDNCDDFIVKLNDIKNIIKTIGTPKQIVFGQDDDVCYNEKKYNKSFWKLKNLRRDKSYNIFGGVCKGFSNYFMISDAIFRLLFIVLLIFAFFCGFALKVLIAYVILWIVIPTNSNINNDDLNYNKLNDVYDVYGKTNSSKTKRVLLSFIFALLIFGGLGLAVWLFGKSTTISINHFQEFSGIDDFEHYNSLMDKVTFFEKSKLVELLYWFVIGIPIIMIIHFIFNYSNKRTFGGLYYFLFTGITIIWLMSVFALSIFWHNFRELEAPNKPSINTISPNNKDNEDNHENIMELDNEDDSEFMEDDMF